ncbi:MAG: hypothetical protein ACE5PT_13500 [Gemmatimonadales bacterium]
MIVASDRLKRLEEQYLRSIEASQHFPDALARFAALWAEARAVDPSIGEHWLQDIDPDLAVARAVNGLPPAT